MRGPKMGRWPSGWYPEDGQWYPPGKQLRWWDGDGWTDYVSGPPVTVSPRVVEDSTNDAGPGLSVSAVLGFGSSVLAWLVLVVGLVAASRMNGAPKPYYVPILMSGIPGLAAVVLSCVGLGRTEIDGIGPGASPARRGRGLALAGMALSLLPPMIFLVIAGGNGNT